MVFVQRFVPERSVEELVRRYREMLEVRLDALAVLPALELRKRRHSIPPYGIDVFEGALHGLVLAEAEFDSDEDMALAPVPPGAMAEVTFDERFTGGRFVALSAADLAELLLTRGACGSDRR